MFLIMLLNKQLISLKYLNILQNDFFKVFWKDIMRQYLHMELLGQERLTQCLDLKEILELCDILLKNFLKKLEKYRLSILKLNQVF